MCWILLFLCLLGNFARFFVVCRFFLELIFLNQAFRNTIRVSIVWNQIMRPKILSKLLAKVISRQQNVRTSRITVNFFDKMKLTDELF